MNPLDVQCRHLGIGLETDQVVNHMLDSRQSKLVAQSHADGPVRSYGSATRLMRRSRRLNISSIRRSTKARPRLRRFARRCSIGPQQKISVSTVLLVNDGLLAGDRYQAKMKLALTRLRVVSIHWTLVYLAVGISSTGP